MKMITRFILRFIIFVLLLLQLEASSESNTTQLSSLNSTLYTKEVNAVKKLRQSCEDVNPNDCVSKTSKYFINSQTSCQFSCSYKLNDTHGPVRLYVRILSSVNNISVFVAAQQNVLISSWTMPITFSEHGAKQIYNTIDEVLCPPFNTEDKLYISIDSSSPKNVSIEFSLMRPPLSIQLNTPVNITNSPVSPWIKYYQWQKDEESVLIYVRSFAKKGKDVCAFLSLQNAKCPVGTRYEDIVSGDGRYQSFRDKGGMVARKELFPDGLFIVILPLPNDAPCTGVKEGIGNITSRGKTVELDVLPHSTMSTKLWAFIVVGGFFFVIAIVSTIFISWCIKRNLSYQNPMFTNEEGGEGLLSHMESPPEDPLVIRREFSAGVVIEDRSASARNSGENVTGSSGESHSLHDESGIPARELPSQGIRERLLAIIADNATLENSRGDLILREAQILDQSERQEERIPYELSKPSQNNNPRFMYWWKIYTEYRNKEPEAQVAEVGFKRNLLIVAVFMALPLSDILRSYMDVFSYNGAEDQCFYNTLCITSFWKFPDFSRMFTNIGYLLFGICFYRIVHVHQYHNMKISAGQALGVSRNYGLFQSLAVGLFIQGVMSALYHVCPNQVTLRFDMMFMYVDAIILIVGIWGLRHGGVTHHVYPTVGLIGGALLAAESREWISDKLFWSVIVIAHGFFTFTISSMLCYLGTWSFSPASMLGIWKDLRPITKNLNEVLRGDAVTNKMHWTIIRTLLGVISNIALMITGPAVDMEVYMYILLVCMVNMVLYVINYITTKVFLCGEKGTRIAWLCIALSGFVWIIALIFFSLHNTNTEVTPASSRGMNSGCIVFGVFDTHDLWHLTSAFAMYCSFVGILTMDDDLARRNPQKIPVF